MGTTKYRILVYIQLQKHDKPNWINSGYIYENVMKKKVFLIRKTDYNNK